MRKTKASQLSYWVVVHSLVYLHKSLLRGMGKLKVLKIQKSIFKKSLLF